MTTLKDLLAQKAALEEEIQTTQKRDRSEAIAKVKTLMHEYDLSVSDLSGKSISKLGVASKGGKVAPKYRDLATGNQWSGRGLQPNWLTAALASGKKLSDFLI
jgi:DNA-binding protein H-NS